MASSASDPEKPNDSTPPHHINSASPSPPEKASRQRSRVGAAWLGGYFDPAAARALKTMAAQQDTTVQVLIARAINDLLEGAGFGRPASEVVLPRGGAAHRHRDTAD